MNCGTMSANTVEPSTSGSGASSTSTKTHPLARKLSWADSRSSQASSASQDGESLVEKSASSDVTSSGRQTNSDTTWAGMPSRSSSGTATAICARASSNSTPRSRDSVLAGWYTQAAGEYEIIGIASGPRATGEGRPWPRYSSAGRGATVGIPDAADVLPGTVPSARGAPLRTDAGKVKRA